MSRRECSVQLLRFATHDADDHGSFIQFQGLGIHGPDQVCFGKLWDFREGFHCKLVTVPKCSGNRMASKPDAPAIRSPRIELATDRHC